MKLLSLEYYKNKNVSYYHFFDALLHYEKQQTKKNIKDILKSLGINPSTYRREKALGKASNITIELLLKHFNYNEVEEYMFEKYETCIQKIYYNSYYKIEDKIQEYLNQLQQYIEYGNYLKPLFVLFKVLGYMNFPKANSVLKNDLIEELNYLKMIGQSYFYEDSKIIYLSVMYYFGFIDDEVDEINILNENEKLKWIYYNTKASRYYMNKKYSEANFYYQKVLKIYKEENNIERIISTIVNIACTYNNLKQYSLSLSLLNDVLDYVYSDKYSLWIVYIIQHYVHALFMLKKYKEILDFYLDVSFSIKKFNSPAVVECILTFYYLGQTNKYNELVDLYKEDSNVKIIVNYLNTGNLEVLNELENIRPFIDLTAQLKLKKCH